LPEFRLIDAWISWTAAAVDTGQWTVCDHVTLCDATAQILFATLHMQPSLVGENRISFAGELSFYPLYGL